MRIPENVRGLSHAPFFPRILAVFLATWLVTVSCGLGTPCRIEGRAGYSLKGRKCTIRAERIYNDGPSGSVSGTLYISVWFLRHRYSHFGETISGYKAAIARLGSLRWNYHFVDVRKRRRFDRPPHGRYFAYLFIEEYQAGRGKVIVAKRRLGIRRF